MGEGDVVLERFDVVEYGKEKETLTLIFVDGR